MALGREDMALGREDMVLSREDRHGGMGRRLSGRIACILREQRVNRKWDFALKPQDTPPGTHFLQ